MTFAPTGSRCHRSTIEKMAKTYNSVPPGVLSTSYTRGMVRRGRGPSFLYLLTVKGRRTGEERRPPCP